MLEARANVSGERWYCPHRLSNSLLQVRELYWHSPESGGLLYTSRRLKTMICPPSEAGTRRYWRKAVNAAEPSPPEPWQMPGRQAREIQDTTDSN